MRGHYRLRPSQFETSERLFIFAACCLAVLVGVFGNSLNDQIYTLFVLWSGLVGMMIPRLREAQRASLALELARETAARQRVNNHDMASALLTIEGGIVALRYLYHEGETPSGSDDVVAARVESIAHAIETEIRRIRRINTAGSTSTDSCDVSRTVAPLIALHGATGVLVAAALGPDVDVAMSSDDLARVVANLLDNCARHAPTARIVVSGRVVDGWYQLNIADNGPGIAADVVDRAFEHGVSSRVGGGLGLYSVRSIVETRNGTVNIDSDSSGTKVALRLPIAPALQRKHALRDRELAL